MIQKIRKVRCGGVLRSNLRVRFRPKNSGKKFLNLACPFLAPQLCPTTSQQAPALLVTL